MARRQAALVAVLLAQPGTTLAEVSDKVRSISDHWELAIPIAIGVFLCGYVRWRLALAAAMVPMFIFLGSVDLALDPYVGGALHKEQGTVYFVSMFSADALMLTASAVGVYIGWRRRSEASKHIAAQQGAAADV